MGIKEWLIPQDREFFRLLGRQSKLVLEAAEKLDAMMSDYTDLKAKRAEIKRVEHEADVVCNELCDRLHKSFITPIDHEDLIGLASAYDDVLDHIDGVANSCAIYDLGEATPAMRKFAAIILACVRELDSTIPKLGKLDQLKINEEYRKVHELENQADDLLNDSIATLLKGTDPLYIIKVKEVYERLERTTDVCDDVAQKIRGIVITHI